MKFILISILFTLFTFIIINCSKNETKNNSEAAVESSEIPDKKMCEILTIEKMTLITGVMFNEAITTIHQTDKATGKYVSQCGYHSDGGNMAVLVRRFGNTSFPKEKEALIGGSKTGDSEIDKMLDDVLNSCKTVTGLGDAAYFYDLGGIYNLILVYNSYYQIHITSYGKGFGFDDNTLQVSKKVAQEVMEIFK